MGRNGSISRKYLRHNAIVNIIARHALSDVPFYNCPALASTCVFDTTHSLAGQGGRRRRPWQRQSRCRTFKIGHRNAGSDQRRRCVNVPTGVRGVPTGVRGVPTPTINPFAGRVPTANHPLFRPRKSCEDVLAGPRRPAAQKQGHRTTYAWQAVPTTMFIIACRRRSSS